jgi:hypothetical protein
VLLIRPRCTLALGLFLGVFGAGLSGQTDLSDLLKRSPFGQATGAAASEQTPGEWEFRGVVDEGESRLVNLYDPATKRSQWVEVNGPAGDVRVLGYDRQANQVQVSIQGRTVVLPLKQAHVALQRPAAPAEPAKEAPERTPAMNREERRAQFRAMLNARPENSGPVPNNLSPEDMAIIYEIRRRRALRDGLPPPAPPAPASPVQPPASDQP